MFSLIKDNFQVLKKCLALRLHTSKYQTHIWCKLAIIEKSKNPTSRNKTLVNGIMLSHPGQHAHYYTPVIAITFISLPSKINQNKGQIQRQANKVDKSLAKLFTQCANNILFKNTLINIGKLITNLNKATACYNTLLHSNSGRLIAKLG